MPKHCLQGPWVNRLPIDENYIGGSLDPSTRREKGRRGHIVSSARQNSTR
jgi:hypothetical protein